MSIAILKTQANSFGICPLICVKEFAKYSFCSPKFFPSEKTFLNANIMFNKLKMLPSDKNGKL